MTTGTAEKPDINAPVLGLMVMMRGPVSSKPYPATIGDVTRALLAASPETRMRIMLAMPDKSMAAEERKQREDAAERAASAEAELTRLRVEIDKTRAQGRVVAEMWDRMGRNARAGFDDNELLHADDCSWLLQKDSGPSLGASTRKGEECNANPEVSPADTPGRESGGADALPTPSDGAGAVEPRASVRWFAQQMEVALRKNDHKGGWHEDDPLALCERVSQEVAELRKELSWSKLDKSKVIPEAADVANMAMMVADHFREFGPSDDQGLTLVTGAIEPTAGEAKCEPNCECSACGGVDLCYCLARPTGIRGRLAGRRALEAAGNPGGGGVESAEQRCAHTTDFAGQCLRCVKTDGHTGPHKVMWDAELGRNEHGEDIYGDAWLLARGVVDLPEMKPSYLQQRAAAHRVLFGPIPEEHRRKQAGHHHGGAGGGDEDGYDMATEAGGTHRDVRNWLDALVKSGEVSHYVRAKLLGYVDRQEKAELDKAERLKSAGALCELYLEDKVSAEREAERLREALTKADANLAEVVRQAAKSETDLRTELQAKGEALAELTRIAHEWNETGNHHQAYRRVMQLLGAKMPLLEPPQPTSASPANRIQLKDPTPSPMPAGGSLLLDQQPTSTSPAKLGGLVDAFREELVRALRQSSEQPLTFGALFRDLADRLDNGAAQ